MTSDQARGQGKSRTALELIIQGAFLCFAVFPLAIPGVIYGWRLGRRFEQEPGSASLVGVFFFVLGLANLAILGVGRYAASWSGWWIALARGNLATLAGESVALVLVGMAFGIPMGLVARAGFEWSRRRHPIYGAGFRSELRERSMAHRLEVARQEGITSVIDGLPVLGTWLDGDEESIRETRRGHLAVLPDSAHHLIALGSTGSGKTETIFRLARAHLELGWKVFVIDGKQDPESARRFAQEATAAKIPESRVRVWPDGGPFDLWRGSNLQEALDKVVSLSDWTEPYYEAVAKAALRLAVEAGDEPPRSLSELLARLDSTYLKSRWAGTERAHVASRLSPELVGGVHLRYFGLDASLRAIDATPEAGQSSWGFEDVDACWFALPTSTTPDIAASFGRCLLVDLVTFIRSAERRTDTRPILLIIEELGALVGEDGKTGRAIVEMLERARSAGVRAVFSAQSPTSLGDDEMQKRLLHSGTSVLAMRMPAPEAVIELLGTRQGTEASLGVTESGGLLNQGSIRLQDQFAVAPDVIRQLPTGRACLIHHGRFTMVQVERI